MLVVSGSIGLAPLVQPLGIPDRINYLHPYRLGPWDRTASVNSFRLLTSSHGLRTDDRVADAVYEALGIGIPHHVQSYFAHLHDSAVMRNLDRVTVEDVAEVYRTELLGPAGQNDLVHYETRLADALEGETYRIALEILAEAATQDVFTGHARRCLERWYAPVMEVPNRHIAEALDVLMHDGRGSLLRGGKRWSRPFRLGMRTATQEPSQTGRKFPWAEDLLRL